tara:strand:- start:554 stop:1015 length:462 start_codon:yes stop_codon:yes gene_type:complete
MKKFNLIILSLGLLQPIPNCANPVEGISDFDASFTKVERIDFECPPNNEKKILKPNTEIVDKQPRAECWVDFHRTHLNIMDKQVINRDDVISFFQSPPASGKCCASWNLIYKDDEGKTKMLSMRRNDLPFPLTKRKLKRLGTPANIINRWLVN